MQPASAIQDTIPMMRYSSLKTKLCDEKRNDILCEYLIVFLVIFPAVIVLWYFIVKDKSAHCDIMVREWSAILLTIYLIWRTISLIQIVVMYECFENKHISSYIIFLFGASFTFAWVIVGNVWFSSDKNNCKEIESTEPYWWLMLFLIIIGDFFMFVYIIALFIIPCIFINYKNNSNATSDGKAP